MKKLLLIAAFGLLASPAFAQSNTATVDQDGIQNEADVAQTGSSTATVTQTGDKQVADVDQIGSRNTGTITQTEVGNPAPPNSSNSATLDQDGHDNTAEITQMSAGGNIANNGSVADVEQDGSNHNATVTQGARTHYAEVNQTNDGDSELGNTADITQSSNEHGTSYIDQVGQSNYAFNFQRGGSSNDSDIDQAGTSNSATVNQNLDSNAGEFASHATSVVEQDGTLNVATVDQRLSVNAEAHIYQQGESNIADIDQANGIGIDPSHYASITQQNGDSNYGRILQDGDTEARNQASITQRDGDSNWAFLDQIGLDGDHFAEVTQTGSSNRVEGLGGVGTAALQSGFDHSLTVSQTGASNVAQVGQVGSGSTATITQN